MIKSVFILLACALSVAFSGELSFRRDVELMKKRDDLVLQSRAEPSAPHELIFSIKQRNLDELEKIVLRKATPGSYDYQKWLTFEEVGELTSNPTSAKFVREWLESKDIKVTWESIHHDYLKATAPIGVWEKLLDTQFHAWLDHSLKGTNAESNLFLRALTYSLPVELDSHLSTIFNTVQAPPKINKKYHTRGSKVENTFKSTLTVKMVDAPKDRKLQSVEDGTVTVPWLNNFYKITSNIGDSSFTQSVFETSSESFSQSDLTTFQKDYSLTIQAAEDIGGFNITRCSPITGDCDEGNLDIQYIMGISQTTTSIYWYVAGADPFVAWVTDIANESNPPEANSMSWGSVEQQQASSVLTQFNTEALKISALGVTVSISSGDDGVANSNCACTTSSSTPSDWSGSNTWTGEGYFPSFPAANPYVTALGATMGPQQTTPSAEVVCQSQLGGVITSGGGFSTFYAQPTWQTSAVSSYFTGLSAQPSAGFNSAGRGYPDLALIGVEYQVVIGGTLISLFGTSCSSPVFAGLISLVNAQRKKNGLTTVGWINPTLYSIGASNPSLFNDITSGSNNCCADSTPSAATCCAAGFSAAKGWDPVSGWGSVNYGNLYDILSAASNKYN
eukprot:gene4236-6013_t